MTVSSQTQKQDRLLKARLTRLENKVKELERIIEELKREQLKEQLSDIHPINERSHSPV